jgi:hypothetical protein
MTSFIDRPLTKLSEAIGWQEVTIVEEISEGIFVCFDKNDSITNRSCTEPQPTLPTWEQGHRRKSPLQSKPRRRPRS